MQRSPDFMNVMNECPLEHHAGFPLLKEESVGDSTPFHAQLSVGGKRILGRLLLLLPSHLKSQPMSRVSLFPPAFLFSICDVLQPDVAVEQNHTSLLPSVLSKLRDWRVLDPNYRCSSAGIQKLALDLAGITDDASTPTSPDVCLAPRPRLRMKWLGSDSPSESRDRESTPPTPSSIRSGVFDPAQSARGITDLDERRFDTRYESYQVGRLDTPDSEDAGVLVSPRRHAASGFRSGCAACRHPRLSGPASAPLSPYRAHMPFSDVNRLDMNSISFVLSPQSPKPGTPYSSVEKTKRGKRMPLHSASRGSHVDENEPPVPKPMGTQQNVGVSFPRQRTQSPRISNALLSREPSLPFGASVQPRPKPTHCSNPARQGDKHTFSHRLASVDLRLSMGKRASPSDLHPHVPTRTQSFPCTAVNAHGFGSVGASIPKPSSNAGASRSSKRLPSWSQTHPTTTTTTSPVRSTISLSSLAVKACLANPHPFGTRSRPSSTSVPPSPLSSDMKHRGPRSPVFSQRHKHTSSLGALPMSPSVHTRTRQV